MRGRASSNSRRGLAAGRTSSSGRRTSTCGRQRTNPGRHGGRLDVCAAIRGACEARAVSGTSRAKSSPSQAPSSSSNVSTPADQKGSVAVGTIAIVWDQSRRRLSGLGQCSGMMLLICGGAGRQRWLGPAGVVSVGRVTSCLVWVLMCGRPALSRCTDGLRRRDDRSGVSREWFAAARSMEAGQAGGHWRREQCGSWPQGHLRDDGRRAHGC